MADEKAYAGNGDQSDANTEYSRIRFIVDQAMSRMATTSLVQVKAYDEDEKTVDVQPMVSQIDGAGSAFPHGTINSLPIWTLQGGDSAILVTPKVGDIGIALFCQSDISSVKETKAPAPPGSRRKFDWADGVYLGGILNPEPTQFVRFSEDGIEITSPDDRPIVITAGGDVTVTAGGDALIEAEGDATVTAGGHVDVNGNDINLNANTAVNGNLIVSGDTSMAGTLVAGALTVDSASIGGKAFATHQHTLVTVGTGDSGPVK